MKVLITGANGLIGKRLTEKFSENYSTVWALTRRRLPENFYKSNSIPVKQADLLDYHALLTLIEPGDIIINAAAEVSYNPSRAASMISNNVEICRNLVNAALEKKAGFFLQVSSVGAIEKPKKKLLVDENEKWDIDAYHSAYAESKFLSELEVWRGLEEGLNAAIINPSLVMSPGDWNRSSLRIFKYVYEGNRFSSSGLANVIDIRDIEEISLKLIKEKITGERFILSSGSLPYQELFDEIARNFQVKAPAMKLPKAIMNLFWRIEHNRSRITGADPIITRDTARLSSSYVTYDNSKIKKKLNYQFIQPIDSIKWVCDEMKSMLKTS